jgi:PPE-repeat protein
VVPVAAVTANRTRLARLLATNGFGTNLPAIAETEEQYQTMWANNSAAMNRYQATSAQATTTQSLFTSPPQIVNPTAAAAQGTAVQAAAATPAATPAAITPQSILTDIETFDPNSGWFGLANTYANQFISSGFPINMLSYFAQTTSAQALQSVGGDIGTGLEEGMSAVGGAAGAAGRLGALGAAGLSAEPMAAIGVGVQVGNLTAPPAVVGLLPASQVQLASAATPLTAADPGFPLPPLMAPPISAGSGWRKRKPQKYEDIAIGKELKGKIMPRPPSAG